MPSLLRFVRHIAWEAPEGAAPFILLVLLALICLYLLGPLPFLALALQWWAASSQDWKDRWGSVRAASVFFTVLVLLIGALLLASPLFRNLLQGLWHQVSWLGSFALWPLLLTTLPARWLLLLPLVPALTLFLEWLDPMPMPSLARVLLPHERAAIQKQQEEAREAAQQAAAEKAIALQRATLQAAQEAQKVADEAAAQQTAEQAVAQDEAAKPTRTGKRPRSTQAKKTRKRLYPQKKRASSSGEDDPTQETETTGADAAARAQEAEPSKTAPVVPPKPKIDWSRVRE